MTDEELDQAKQVATVLTQAVIAAALPEIMKVVAASKPNLKEFSQVGEISVMTAYEPLLARDYRKETWLEAYLTAPVACDRVQFANMALNHFDVTFPR